tara:strand:- start:165 stop:647 length:483 start_codon:yes stop_codon:yes gene_type:complete
MTVINVTSGSQATLNLGTTEAMSLPGGTDVLVVPLMQDVTVSATTGTTRYSVLSNPSSSAFTTTNENSVSINMLVDGATFFGDGADTNSIANLGLLQTSKNKTEIFWTVAFNEGNSSGEYYVKGKGFLTGLTPTASMDAAVWVSPMEIVVNGEITPVTVS